jgi:hypothetical protein
VVELPDLVAGRHPGRTSDGKAEEFGLGTELSLWRDPIWT